MILNITEQVNAFLHQHALDADSINESQILDDFRREMERGLQGQPSSLKMLPSFLETGNLEIDKQCVIVIDAGGTNLRISLISFNNSGEPSVEYLKKYAMPGSKEGLSAEEFYRIICSYLEPIIDRSDSIGFCFSYPADISSNRDGKLINWTKGINVPEVVGAYIGEGLLDALGNKGKGKKVVLLNDTVATLFAGMTMKGGGKDFSSYIGFILGTGTNTAYIERNSNIVKCPDLNSKMQQAVNIESGNFTMMPAGDIFKEFDAESTNPGEQLLEKMISGLYRGSLILKILKRSAAEGLFSAKSAENLNSIDELSAFDVDLFLLERRDGCLFSLLSSLDDERTVKKIVTEFYRRCAKITALNISATVLKSGKGLSMQEPLCINIDGSTYYKSVGFQEMTEGYLSKILTARGISYKTVQIDDSPLLGAAVAGLSVK